jgi:phosphate:Na+ symporter
VSPSAPELTGKARMAAEVPRQIANAHTIFNVANTLLFLGFTGTFARVVEKLLPDRPVEKRVIVRPRFLDRAAVEVPALALEQVRFELGHMGEIINDMMTLVQKAWQQRDRAALDAVLRMDDKVDILHEAILEYLALVRREALTEQQSREFQALMSATIHLEGLADVIETGLVGLGKQVIDRDLRADDTTRVLFVELADRVMAAVQRWFAPSATTTSRRPKTSLQ